MACTSGLHDESGIADMIELNLSLIESGSSIDTVCTQMKFSELIFNMKFNQK
jgi:hypothetical protein